MTSRRLLLAGEGHTALAVHHALSAAGLAPAVCTTDTALAAAAGSAWPGDLAAAVDGLGPDLVVTAGWKPLVPESLLARARFVNVHHSLLPRYRGLHAIIWALLNGEPEVGVTIHEVDPLVDHGPILWQASTATADKTSWQLMLELDQVLAERVGRVVHAYLDGDLVPVPQDDGAATFVGRRHPDDCRIDWAWTAPRMSRMLRALVAPYPRPFFEYRGQRWTVERAAVDGRDYVEIPGHVVYRDGESVWVKLGTGLLRLYEIAADGERRPARDVFATPGARLAGSAS